MKRFTQVVSVLLIVVMLFSTTAFAAEAENSRASNYFMASSVYFWRSSGNNYQIWFDVTAVGTMSELGAREIKVEYSTDGVNWSRWCTYNKSSYSQMTTTAGTARYANYVPFTATNGYCYRAVVSLYAKNSSGSGVMTETTPVLDLR